MPPPEKPPPLLWKFHLLPFLNWLKILSTLMPRLRIPADSVLFLLCPRSCVGSKLLSHLYCRSSRPHQRSPLSPLSHNRMSRFPVSGLSFGFVCTCRSRGRTPCLGTSLCLSSCHFSLSGSSLSCLYSWTATTLLRCAPRSLYSLCSTLLVALLSLCLFLLLGICCSRTHSSLSA